MSQQKRPSGRSASPTRYEAELDRLWQSPRYAPVETDLLGGVTKLLDGPSFVSQYREIVVAESYDFECEGHAPVIIDGGANIGVAILWWLSRWPDARIIAFEPDPDVFSLLEQNVPAATNVELRQAALTTPDLGTLFVPEGSDAGRLTTVSSPLAENADSTESAEIHVPSVRLRDLLDEVGEVDLLKLDIEGAETAVLHDAETDLERVHRIFVEYHSFVGRRQDLSDLLRLLRRNGFRVYLASPPPVMRPFKGVPTDRGIDMQVNIWAWRPPRDAARS